MNAEGLLQEIADYCRKAGMAETRYRMHNLKAARILWRQALDAFRVVDVPEAADVANRLAALEV